MRSALLAVFTALLLLPVAPASAAPPDNDNRADAIRINPPQTVNGTVRDATVEDNEAFSDCETGDGTVWYRFTAPQRGAVVVQLDAGGDLDASIDVFQRERSELTQIDCDSTDKKGLATLDLDNLKGEYLIRVSKQFDSDPGPFSLAVLVPSAPARPPGKPLPFKGAKDTVDGLVNPSDAYATQMSAGTTYKLSLKAPQCTHLSVYGPGGGFNGSPAKELRCGGYRLFTPEKSGRYSLLVEAGRSRGAQKYALNVKRAGLDDSTPGIFIRNNAKVRGHVNGKADSVDLYRFDVTTRSSLTLRVSGGPDLTLLKPGGRRIESNSSFIARDVPVGRYYVAVRGRGSYTLRRISKTITHSRISFNGRRKAFAAPGASAQLVLSVNPNVAGKSTILIEKFDPLEGWQFLRRIHPRVSGGRAALTFSPPGIGRYRATATFRGSKLASSSDAGQAKLNVRSPVLQQ